MMTTTLVSPYDTGERCEPIAWPTSSPEHYGRVDFDNDEGRTVATVYVERDENGGAM